MVPIAGHGLRYWKMGYPSMVCFDGIDPNYGGIKSLVDNLRHYNITQSRNVTKYNSTSEITKKFELCLS